MSTFEQLEKTKYEYLTNYGPYYRASGGVTWVIAGVTLHIFIYEGFNAGGLIGTEHNGIGILQTLPTKEIVMDGWMTLGAGSDGARAKNAERDRIVGMTAVELHSFFEHASNSPRCVRFNPIALVPKRAVRAKSVAPGKDFYKNECLGRYSATKQYHVVRAFGTFLHDLTTASDTEKKHWRDGVIPKSFTRDLYELHMNEMGHIAHYNASGFFGEQYAEHRGTKSNLIAIAAGNNLFGFPLSLPKTMVDGLAEVAKHFLTKLN